MQPSSPSARHRSGQRHRVIVVSVLVGALTALTTLVFFYAVEYASHVFQHVLMGISHPVPAGEQLPVVTKSGGEQRHWLIVILPAVGAALGGLLVHRFYTGARGHAIDTTIRAFHRGLGHIPFQQPLVRACAAVLTIGSGGSAGRIGPNAHIGAGIGSWLADRLGLSHKERRTLAMAGCAAGIGTICRAPLGGALTAVEILYKDDFDTSSVVPSLVSSLTGYSVLMWFLSTPFAGQHGPTIHEFPELSLQMPWDMVEYLVLTLVCALGANLFIRLFFGLKEQGFDRLRLPFWIRCGIGGLGVGLLGLFGEQVLGGGMGYLQTALDTEVGAMMRHQVLLLGLSFLTFAVLKMIATGLTIGSGGSGGVFGPALVVGGLFGAGVGCLFHALVPAVHPPPLAGFVVVGMAAFFAGVANAPVGAVILVSEFTGSYTLMAPVLLASIINYLLLRHRTLYEHQAGYRHESRRGPAGLRDEG